MAEFLAVGEACKAIFQPAPGLQEGNFYSSRFSAVETLSTASVVPRCWAKALGKNKLNEQNHEEVGKGKFAPWHMKPLKKS